MGPTCSGKTKAATQLANYLKCPIISADAFQIYKGMNIGTAKISASDTNYNKHYLLDLVSPEETFSVKQYQDIFRKTLDELLKSNKNIIVCGGTGLYIKACFFDYVFEDEENRNQADYDKYDNDSLWNLLYSLDSEAASNIHKNNRKRVIRALQICNSHIHNKTENINMQSHSLIYKNVCFLFINPNRELLYQNINKRVDEMFENGLVEEVKNLLNMYNLSLTSKQAIGYKEVIEYLNNNFNLETCKEKIKQRTRNYAKRQITFFLHQFKCEVFENADDLIKEIIKREQSF